MRLTAGEWVICSKPVAFALIETVFIRTRTSQFTVRSKIHQTAHCGTEILVQKALIDFAPKLRIRQVQIGHSMWYWMYAATLMAQRSKRTSWHATPLAQGHLTPSASLMWISRGDFVSILPRYWTLSHVDVVCKLFARLLIVSEVCTPAMSVAAVFCHAACSRLPVKWNFIHRCCAFY